MLNVVVIDAQGGGLGASIVKKLTRSCAGQICITALGTSKAAAAAMRKSGANRFASGESAICSLVSSADVIIGGIGIIAAYAMLGEITPRIAKAVAQSKAKKILIPITKCNYFIPGTASISISALVDEAVAHICSLL